MIGASIGPYRITGRLGQGGMGVVYQAEDTRLNRAVALKLLPEGKLDQTRRMRFVREAHVAAQVQHPHICPIYDIGEADGQLYIAMALLEGKTVAQMIAAGPLNTGLALDIAIQITQALEQAHRRGVVHRDIKSSNIMVSPDGNASLLDFGLALMPDASRLTTEGFTMGTPPYMSPEQAQGLAVDYRTDIWSLGIVLFEMITGSLPFRAEQPLALFHSIVTGCTPSLTALRPEAGPEVERVVEVALEKNPAARWQSAAEMGAQLQAVRNSRRATTQTVAEIPTLAASTAQTLPLRRTSRRLLAGLAISGLVAMSALAYLGVRKAILPAQRQVAVLPLEVVGNDADARVMADGLVETVTAQLTQLEQFAGKMQVVPSSEIRARKIQSAEDARKQYGANLVISGSAQRWGDRLQFTFTLIDAARLRQVGSKSIEFDSSNPIAFRNGAIDSVVGLLDVELSPAARKAVARGETSTGNAYMEYLRGRGYLARYDAGQNLEHALESLQRAVNLDPGYALARAALAEALWWKALRTNDTHWKDRATQEAEKAVSLDDNLAAAHAALGRIYTESGRHEEALKQLKRARELAPDSAEPLRALASLYVSLGRVKEAEAAFLDATRRRPTDWYGHLLLGYFYLQRGRFAEAERALLAARQLTPDSEVVYRNLGVVYIRQGRYKDARDQLLAALKLEPAARTYSTLGLAYYYDGRLAEAASALEASIDLDSSNYMSWGNLGTIYRHMAGSEIKAKAAFSRAVELGEKGLVVTPNDPRIRANIAEYMAKLGQKQEALSQLDAIAPVDRERFLDRVVLVYELTGDRAKAIAAIRSSSLQVAFLQYIKDDPDLAGLWKDPALQRAISERRAELAKTS